jgi:organic radical activating enzyme
MPEDYVCVIMTSGDAHHISGTGGDPGLDFLSHSDVDSQIKKMSRLGLMIQWPDNAGNPH